MTAQLPEDTRERYPYVRHLQEDTEDITLPRFENNRFSERKPRFW